MKKNYKGHALNRLDLPIDWTGSGEKIWDLDYPLSAMRGL
jgi:hypothetical protein